MAKKDATVEIVQGAVFTREQFMKAEAYQTKKDIVSAIFEQTGVEALTKEQVNNAIEDYMKGQVK